MTPSELWSNYVDAHARMVQCRMAMHSDRKDLVEHVRAALKSPGVDGSAALSYIPYLGEWAVSVLEDLIRVALSVHGDTARARQLVADLPRAESIAELERAERDVMSNKDYEAWACIFQLWVALGREDRARELATRASLDDDEDVRDVGVAFLESASHRGG